MSRINTNVDSIVALNNLSRTNSALGVSLTRLSTGVKINSGKDDPAGLISGEFLRQEISSVKSALQNNTRANNLLATADTALGEINTLLDGVRGLITTSANSGVLSQDELNANQQAVDAALSSIDRIATNTQFGGKKLLDGSLGFQLTGVTRFDSASATFTDLNVRLANFNNSNTAIAVTVTLVSVATQATLALASATATDDSTIEVVGNKGSIVLTIASGQAVAAAINAVSDATGVQATGANLNSVGYGESSFVTVRNLAGSLLANAESNDLGANANVVINGQKAYSDGLNVSLRTAGLEVEFTTRAGLADGATSTFTVSDGGARFQLGGEVNQSNQVTIGLNSFSSASLGNSTSANGNRTLSSIRTGGSNSLVADKGAIAADIVKEAIGQVTRARASLGAIQKYTIESNTNSLQVALENLSSARSAIVDTDFASETAALTRLQVLNQAGNSALAIANSRPQSVLSLLG